jgi:hypothetical protein
MNRYKVHPMDFADATLVHLAERESIQVVSPWIRTILLPIASEAGVLFR